MRLLLAILLAFGLCGVQAEDNDLFTEGLPQPTPEQLELQCIYQGQLVRGLVSVMSLLQQVTGEVPPIGFMASYIASFYDRHNPNEAIAAASAADALKWIYENQPINGRKGEADYYRQCKGESNGAWEQKGTGPEINF